LRAMSTEPLAPRGATLSERVAAEVRAHAGRTGANQAFLARLLDISQPQMSARMRGRMPFRLDELEVLAKAFGIEARDFLPASDAPLPVLHDVAPATRRHQAGRVNERYLAAIIHGSERRSSRDEWRIRELRGSHELPILARRHGHNLRICRSVAA